MDNAPIAQPTTLDLVKTYITECAEGKQTSLAPLLSTYTIRGEPMSLKAHFQMYPMFKLRRPRTQTWRCARQVAKSYSICALGGLLSGFIPDFNALYVQPRFDQIKRLNNTVMRPLLKSNVLQNDMLDGENLRALGIKHFNNNSIQYMDFAFMSVERLRGITGCCANFLDEVQDIDIDFLPIIRETMSADIRYGYTMNTGTPKTTDNTLSLLYDAGSGGHWGIRCGCGKWNICAEDQDIFKMIGDKTIICAKCGKPLDTRLGKWLHARPDLRNSHESYHVSQVTHPYHCAIPEKWQDLLDKIGGPGAYTKLKLYNEVFGIPCDDSVNLLTIDDIRAASNGFDNDYQKCVAMCSNYDMRVLGVDWSGGGALGHSFTSGAIVGSKPGSDVLDCIFKFRLQMGLKPEEEAQLLAKYFEDFKCNFFAHDYTGAGYLREVLMAQNGIQADKLIPFTYAVSPRKDVVSRHMPADGSRSSFILDKPRSLALMISLIKNHKITLPAMKKDRSILQDLLALVEDPRELDRGNILYLISKKANKSDDFAHGLNFATSAIWYSRGGYPQITDLSRYQVAAATAEAIDPFWSVKQSQQKRA